MDILAWDGSRDSRNLAPRVRPAWKIARSWQLVTRAHRVEVTQPYRDVTVVRGGGTGRPTRTRPRHDAAIPKGAPMAATPSTVNRDPRTVRPGLHPFLGVMAVL